jgi:hypothetical protein
LVADGADGNITINNNARTKEKKGRRRRVMMVVRRRMTSLKSQASHGKRARPDTFCMRISWMG